MDGMKWGIAVMCTLGMGAAMAQNVQVGAAEKAGETPPPNVMVLRPVIVGQAAGGAASGASTAGETATAATTGTMMAVGIGVAAVAIAASNGGGGTVTHH